MIGRLTAGTHLPARSSACDATVGARLAEFAALEAAAVVAFERLACDLEALGAPADLVARAREAADDERRHARDVGAAARARGGVVEPVHIEPHVPQTCLALALENAREGLVRETYGAAVAHVMVAALGDPSLRALYSTIADEETSHAALSLDLAAWFDTQLCGAERAAVRRARDAACAELRASLQGPTAHDADAALGMPTGARALALFDAVLPSAWALADAA